VSRIECCWVSNPESNQDSSYWGIFCIDATSPETAELSFSRILKIAKIERVETSNQRAAKDWLSSLDRPWLLIVDNADDDNPSHSLLDYFPDGERGCILVTTRDPMKKVHGNVGPKFYHFDKLDTEEANNLLLKAACQPSPWDVSTIKSANSIANVLGFLPLALVQAGKAIMNGFCSLANYTEHYRKSWQRIRHARKKSGHKGDETTNWNVYSSYEINLKRLEELDDEEAHDAVELLKMFSCLHCEDIRIEVLITAAGNPRVEQEQRDKDKEEEDCMKMLARPKTWGEYFRDRIFKIAEFVTRDRGPVILPAVLRDVEPLSPFDEFRLRQALGRLSRMSLITQHDSSEVYSMHPLVHTWVRERPDKNAEQALWCQAAATALTQAILLPPHGSSAKEEDMRRSLLPHINHVRKCQVEISAKIADNRRLRKITWMSAVKSKFGRRQALESAKFSRVYQECGLWKEAEMLQLRVKEFVLKELGPEHPYAIGIMLLLAGTYQFQGRTNEAAELQGQVYQACLKSLGPDHPKTLKVMDTLGSSRCSQGRFADSLELHEKAIAGMKKIKTLPKPEDLYIAMGNRASMLWRYFRYEEAREVRAQVLEGLQNVLGPTHLQTLTAMEDLALSYIYCGEEWLEQAHELMLEVLKQRETRVGKEHPFTLLAMCSLARVKSAMGETADAEKVFRKGIPIAERVLGENYIGTLAGKAHFASVLMKRKLYDEAEELLLKVVGKQKYTRAAREDGDHPDRIMALWALVQCYELHGKTDDALAMVGELEYVIANIGGQGLGKLHPFAKRLEAKRDELESSKMSEMDEDAAKTDKGESQSSAESTSF
jgi:tetratricopeptide (TPR) repeat protein